MATLIRCLIGLTLLATTCAAQDQWSAYQPRTLNQLIELNRPLLTEENVGLSFLFTDHFPSRVQVVYTGKSRALTKEKMEMLSAWAKSRKVDKEIVAMFEKEMLFIENSVEHWLPIQKQLQPHFEQELKPDHKVELLLMLIGARKENGRVDWVFLVNEFNAD